MSAQGFWPESAHIPPLTPSLQSFVIKASPDPRVDQLPKHVSAWTPEPLSDNLDIVADVMKIPSKIHPRNIRVSFDESYTNQEIRPARDADGTLSAYGGEWDSLAALKS